MPPTENKRGRKQNTPEQLWERYTENNAGCWIYTKSLDRYGYGQFAYHGYSGHRAHVVAWILTHGPIKKNLTINHKCAVPSCINPDHLELLSPGDNSKEAISRRSRPIQCKNGHVGQYKKRPKGGRYCMECDRTIYRMKTTKWKKTHDKQTSN